jgi:L-malate glycosyltransferase
MTACEEEAPAPPREQFPANESPVNVFLMTDSLETGGSERQFSALARSLNPDAFSVHLGCIQKRGAFLDGLGDIQEFPLGHSLYGLPSVRMRYRLSRHLRLCKIALAHAFDFYTNLTVVPAARLARVPVVIGSQRQLGDLLTRAKARAQLELLRCCDAVVCNSQAAAERLIRRGLTDTRVVVIPNGVPAEVFVEAAPALPRRPGLLRVGMIARMNSPAKNHRLVIHSAARLRARLPGVEFVLIGDGPLRPELEREAESLGLRDRVRFLGERRDIPAILASLDLSVLPSTSESLSNSILESMAAGVPTVASDVGGNPELVTEQRGILVPVNDEEALAAAMERLLTSDELRKQFGKNAKQFAAENFTMEQMRKRHEELYSELLDKKDLRRKHRYAGGSRSLPNPKCLRVALVAASLRYVGGQSVQADLLLRHWKQDREIEAKLIPIDPTFPLFLRWIERIPFLRTIVRQPIYMWHVWRDLREADIAHIFSASYWSFLVAPAPALLVARLQRKRTLIHYHSGEARDHLRRFRTAQPILKWADRVVVPSAYLRDEFRQFGIESQVVPNFIDLSRFSFRMRNPLRPHLVCTRGFHPYYCIDVVVRAFARIQRVFPDACLDLVGGGPLEGQIRKLVRTSNLQRVTFVGVTCYQDIGRFYNQADIFINASRLDNMPVSILEAFASGTPVVTTAAEGIRYLVEHERTGLLCETGDDEALARNVLRLLQDPNLVAQLVCSGYEQAKCYSWAEIRPQWLQTYRSLHWNTPKTTSELNVT